MISPTFAGDQWSPLQSNSDDVIRRGEHCSPALGGCSKKNGKENRPFSIDLFNKLGLKFDDLIILGILFLLYTQKTGDIYIYIALFLLLIDFDFDNIGNLFGLDGENAGDQ